MHIGLTISVLMHLAVLAWALINIQSTPPFKMPDPEPVEVALISPDDLVRLRQGSRTAKQLEAKPSENQAKEPPKEQPKQKMQATAPPPPPPPAADPPPPPEPVKAEPPPPPPPPPEPAKVEPKPSEPVKAEPVKDPIAEKLAALPPPEPEGPSAEELKQKADQEKAQKAEQERQQQEELKRQEEIKKEEIKKEEIKKAEETHKAEEKKKAEEAKKKLEHQKKLAEAKRKADEAKKKQFDADKIAALLNKVPDKSAPPAGSPVPSDAFKPKGPVAGAPEGRDSQLTASQRSALVAMLRRSVERCWNINAGLDGANRLVPVVEFELNRDGTIRGVPRVVNPNGSPQFQDAANSAIRAVVQCAPYNLPQENYSDWEIARLRFDPQGMF